VHPEAYEWVAKHATSDPVTVLDLGGRNINGSPRDLFPNATVYTVLDVVPGPGVEIVADAAVWYPGERRWQVVVCCEVFEHAFQWPAICRTAWRALGPGGRLIVTTAAPGRAPHSGVDGGPLHPGEYYANIHRRSLQAALQVAGFTDIETDVQPASHDLRAVAVKPLVAQGGAGHPPGAGR
jgi:Methyltransferase domain